MNSPRIFQWHPQKSWHRGTHEGSHEQRGESSGRELRQDITRGLTSPELAGCVLRSNARRRSRLLGGVPVGSADRIADHAGSQLNFLSSESPDPPVVWPRFANARMRTLNAGARVAPTTIEIATTIGRDAKKSSPDEGRGSALERQSQPPR